MVDVTVDSNVDDLSAINFTGRSLVWTSSSVGYIFFIDAARNFNYRKTTILSILRKELVDG